MKVRSFEIFLKLPLEKKKCDKFSIYMGSVTKDGVEMTFSTIFEEGDVVTIT